MESLLKQLNYDIMSMEYLARIDAKLNPANLQVIRNYFNNDSDTLLDAILSMDECRKAKGNVIIEQFRKVKRYNRRRKTAA
jgi:hypothetical protein